MLELKGVRCGYGLNDVVHGVDLEVRAGEIVALVGANGAGKSTLARAISGIVPLRAGEIVFEGRRIDRRTPRERVLAGIAHVPEGRQVFPGLTCAENLLLGAYAQSNAGEAAERRVQDVCERFPALLERLHHPAGALSGGQQQMLAIARGLMAAPRLLVLDEPSLGLAPVLVQEIFAMIAALRARGISVLLSEQNARMSLAIADRAYVIENGRVALQGAGAELLGRAEVAERYLGVGHAVESGEARHERLVQGLRSILGRVPVN